MRKLDATTTGELVARLLGAPADHPGGRGGAHFIKRPVRPITVTST